MFSTSGVDRSKALTERKATFYRSKQYCVKLGMKLLLFIRNTERNSSPFHFCGFAVDSQNFCVVFHNIFLGNKVQCSFNTNICSCL